MRLRGIRLLIGAALAAVAGASAASVGINKSFTPNSVSVGQRSTLTIVLLNSNASSATGTGVTDALPANVVVANPANASTTCAGVVTAAPGSGSVGLGNGTIPAASGGSPGQCQLTVDVVSGTAGTYIDTIPASAVSSSQGTNTQPAQASLVVAALANITGTKVFSPGNLHGAGSASTVTITLNNPNGIALTNVAFTDTFPASLALATPPNVTNTCGGTVTAAGGGTSVKLAAGTVAASGNCAITFQVVTPDPTTTVNATRTNTIAANAVTTAQGVRNSAIQGGVTVQSGANLTKAFAPTTITAGGKSVLTITVTNFNATALGGITLTDTFPVSATGNMVVANPANASTTCGGTLTANPGDAGITLSGGALAAAPSGAGGTSCTIKVSVTATNSGVAATTLTNSLPAGSFAGINHPAASGALTVNPSSAITGTKTYSPAPVATGTTRATVTLTNTTSSAAMITSFTDDLATLGPGFTVAASPAPGGTCGATITAPPGGTSVTATGGTIPHNGSCTIAFSIAIAGSASVGTHTNTIAANAVQTTQGGNTFAITGAMNVAAAFTGTKAFSPTSVRAGSRATTTITLTRNANAGALSGIAFTDTLPASHTVASPPNASTTCGGTLTANAGAGSFALSGGSLASGAGATSCTVSVDIATPATAGSATNTIAAGAITTAQGATNAAFSAALARALTSVTVNKSFNPTTVAVGGTSQLVIEVRNNNANAIALGSLGLTDNFPIGMTIGSPADLAFSGSGCSTAANGLQATATQLVLSGATVNANSICTLTANVQATAAGNLIDTLPPGVVIDAQGVTNPAGAAATLASSGTASLSIANSDGVSSVVPGGTTTYTVVVSNGGPDGVAGLLVNDAPAPGVTFTSWTCTASSGSQCTASGSGAVADSTTLLNGGTLTYTIEAAFALGISGTTTNTASLGVPGSVVDTGASTSASDTDVVTPITSLAATLTDGSPTYVPGLGGTYVIVVSNGGPSDATNVTVADALPAGATLAGTVTCAAAGGASCGSVTGSAGDASFGATGAVVKAGGGSRLTFTVAVAFAADMAAPSITDTVTASDAASGGSASASDTDTRAAQVALSAGKSDGASTYTPGETGVYTVVASNAGPSSAVDVLLADALPSGVTLSASATCSASPGSSCGTVSGAPGAPGANASGASIAPGGTLALTIPVQFASAMTAASITNTATATDAASGASAMASDVDTLESEVALAITNSDGSATYTPGGSAVYTIVLTNAGPSDASSVNVADTLPPGVTLAGAVGCAATGNASCGSVAGTAGQTSFTATGASAGAAPGDALTFTLPVSFAPSLALDPLVNSVDAIDTATGETASASDADTRSLDVSLAVVKSDGSATYTPGGSAVYTVMVTNGGVSDAQNVTVSDALPAGATLSADVTCAVNGDASCGTVSGTTGEASFGATAAHIAAGAGNSVVYSVPVRFDAALAIDPLVNTANATDVVSGASGSASDSDARLAAVTLAVATTDGQPTYVPGGTATYAITVTNNGTSDALDVAIDDTLPAGVVLTAAVTCNANGNASCGTLAGSAGDAHFGATGASVAAGAGNSVVLTAPVRFAPGLTDDPLIDAATATDIVSGASGSGSDADALAAQSSLAISKTDDSATYLPGGIASYVIVVTNAGPSDASSVSVVDDLPPGVTLRMNATCTPTGNAACGAVTGTSGDAAAALTGATIAAGAGNQLTLVVPVQFAAQLSADPLVNSASASASGGAAVSASDSDARVIGGGGQSALVVSLTDNASTYTPGGTAVYVIRIGNTGSAAATGVSLVDLLPAGVTLSAPPSCNAEGSATCGTLAGALGGGTVTLVGASITPGAGNALIIAVPVRFSATLDADPLVNTVTATSDAGAVAVASDSNVRATEPAARAIPVDHPLALLLLVACIAQIARRRARA